MFFCIFLVYIIVTTTQQFIVMSSLLSVLRVVSVFESVCLSVWLLFEADSRSSLIKVYFDQLSGSDFWCCLCSRILRQPQGSTSNLNKHLQARHSKEYRSIIQVMSEDSVVKVENAAGTSLFRGSNF